MNYEKLTLDRFALNLKEGKYATLTGARRAIGKTSSWNAKEKEAAHGAANKHFKVEGGAAAAPAAKPAAKAATKAVAAKTAAKPAKKQARKAIKKPAATKAVAAPRDVADDVDVETAAPAERPVSARKPTNAVTSHGETTVSEAVSMGNQVLGFFNEAKNAYEFQKSVNPNGDFSKTLTAMHDGLTRAVTLVSKSLPPSESIDSLPPARVALPKETPAPKAETKKVAPVTTAPTTAAAPSFGSLPVPGTFNGTGTPLTPAPEGVNDAHLTDEEKEQARALRNATPASTIPAIPRVSAQS